MMKKKLSIPDLKRKASDKTKKRRAREQRRAESKPASRARRHAEAQRKRKPSKAQRARASSSVVEAIDGTRAVVHGGKGTPVRGKMTPKQPVPSKVAPRQALPVPIEPMLTPVVTIPPAASPTLEKRKDGGGGRFLGGLLDNVNVGFGDGGVQISIGGDDDEEPTDEPVQLPAVVEPDDAPDDDVQGADFDDEGELAWYEKPANIAMAAGAALVTTAIAVTAALLGSK